MINHLKPNNHYGDLLIKEENNKYFIAIEDWDTYNNDDWDDWFEISSELYDLLFRELS